MSARELAAGSTQASLYSATITTAITAVGQTPLIGIVPFKYLAILGKFVFGSGGTSADVWVQTSLDKGVSWFDIANFHFLVATASKLHAVVWDPATPFTAGQAPVSGTLAANTVLNGILGDRIRALVTTVGTYAGGTTFNVDVVAKG